MVLFPNLQLYADGRPVPQRQSGDRCNQQLRPLALGFNWPTWGEGLVTTGNKKFTRITVLYPSDMVISLHWGVLRSGGHNILHFFKYISNDNWKYEPEKPKEEKMSRFLFVENGWTIFCKYGTKWSRKCLRCLGWKDCQETRANVLVYQKYTKILTDYHLECVRQGGWASIQPSESTCY